MSAVLKITVIDQDDNISWAFEYNDHEFELVPLEVFCIVENEFIQPEGQISDVRFHFKCCEIPDGPRNHMKFLRFIELVEKKSCCRLDLSDKTDKYFQIHKDNNQYIWTHKYQKNGFPKYYSIILDQYRANRIADELYKMWDCLMQKMDRCICADCMRQKDDEGKNDSNKMIYDNQYMSIFSVEIDTYTEENTFNILWKCKYIHFKSKHIERCFPFRLIAQLDIEYEEDKVDDVITNIHGQANGDDFEQFIDDLWNGKSCKLNLSNLLGEESITVTRDGDRCIWTHIFRDICYTRLIALKEAQFSALELQKILELIQDKTIELLSDDEESEE